MTESPAAEEDVALAAADAPDAPDRLAAAAVVPAALDDPEREADAAPEEADIRDEAPDEAAIEDDAIDDEPLATPVADPALARAREAIPFPTEEKV